MGRFVIKAIRSATATILIAGSIYVQHVARAQQAAAGEGELKSTEALEASSPPASSKTASRSSMF